MLISDQAMFLKALALASNVQALRVEASALSTSLISTEE